MRTLGGALLITAVLLAAAAGAVWSQAEEILWDVDRVFALFTKAGPVTLWSSQETIVHVSYGQLAGLAGGLFGLVYVLLAVAASYARPAE